MSNVIKVDTADIRQKANNILTSANQIESEINALTAKIKSLHNTWDGKAANSFQHAYEGWRQITPKMKAALDSLELAAKQIAENYDDAELKNMVK